MFCALRCHTLSTLCDKYRILGAVPHEHIQIHASKISKCTIFVGYGVVILLCSHLLYYIIAPLKYNCVYCYQCKWTAYVTVFVLKRLKKKGGTDTHMSISKKDRGKRVGIHERATGERERERERERLTFVDPARGSHLKQRYQTLLFAQINLNGILFHIVSNKIFLQHYANSHWWTPCLRFTSLAVAPPEA